MWSGCMWVQITPFTGLRPSSFAKRSRHIEAVSSLPRPVSTTYHPSLSSIRYRLMWFSDPPMGMVSQRTPSATSMVCPGEGCAP